MASIRRARGILELCRKCAVRVFQCAGSGMSSQRRVLIRKASILGCRQWMLKLPSAIGKARISRVISGCLLSQKNLLIICSISDIAH